MALLPAVTEVSPDVVPSNCHHKVLADLQCKQGSVGMAYLCQVSAAPTALFPGWWPHEAAGSKGSPQLAGFLLAVFQGTGVDRPKEGTTSCHCPAGAVGGLAENLRTTL